MAESSNVVCIHVANRLDTDLDCKKLNPSKIKNVLSSNIFLSVYLVLVIFISLCVLFLSISMYLFIFLCSFFSNIHENGNIIASYIFFYVVAGVRKQRKT